MFSLVMVRSNDIERSRKFCDELFTTIDAKPSTEDPQGRLVYQHNGSMSFVTPPIDGEPAARHGSTVGFSVSGPDQAYAWHQAGIAAGGKAIEGKPGKRLVHRVNMFAAYGWHAGFGLAAALMLLALVIYMSGQRHCPTPARSGRSAPLPPGSPPPRAAERGRCLRSLR